MLRDIFREFRCCAGRRGDHKNGIMVREEEGVLGKDIWYRSGDGIANDDGYICRKQGTNRGKRDSL